MSKETASFTETWEKQLVDLETSLFKSMAPVSRQAEAITALTVLLAEAKRYPGINKKLSSGLLARLLARYLPIAHKSPILHHVSLLETCLFHYSGIFSVTGSLLRDWFELVGGVDLTTESFCAIAAKCYALLPKLGPSGERGTKHAAAWSIQISEFVRVAHETLHEMLRDTNLDATGCKTPAKSDAKLPYQAVLPGMPEEKSYETLFTYFRLTVKTVCNLLLQSPISHPVNVPVGLLVSLMKCSVTLAPCDVSDEALVMFIPKIQSLIIELISCSVMALDTTLLAFVDDFMEILLRLLFIYHDNDARIQIWESLAALTTNLGPGGYLPKSSDRLLKHILSDLEPLKSPVASDIAVVAVKKKSSKKRKSAGNTDVYSVEEYKDSSVESFADFKGKVLLVSAVSMNLEKMLPVISHRLEPSFHRQLSQFVARLLLKAQSSVMPPPYNKAECRSAIYRLLANLLTSTNPKTPPPIHPAVGLFNRGLLDKDPGVREACQAGLNRCSMISAPFLPPLECPFLDVEQPIESASRKRWSIRGEEETITVEDDAPPAKKTMVNRISPRGSPVICITPPPEQGSFLTPPVIDTLARSKRPSRAASGATGSSGALAAVNGGGSMSPRDTSENVSSDAVAVHLTKGDETCSNGGSARPASKSPPPIVQSPSPEPGSDSASVPKPPTLVLDLEPSDAEIVDGSNVQGAPSPDVVGTSPDVVVCSSDDENRAEDCGIDKGGPKKGTDEKEAEGVGTEFRISDSVRNMLADFVAE